MPTLGLEDPATVEIDSKEAAALKKRADIIMAVSAFSILFCLIGGGIATYMAYQAQQDLKAGDLTGAAQYLRMAKVWMMLAIGIPVFIAVFDIVVFRFA